MPTGLMLSNMAATMPQYKGRRALPARAGNKGTPEGHGRLSLMVESDCEVRRKLASELSEAIRAMTTRDRTNAVETLFAKRNRARTAYWAHVAEHGCDNPARQLNSLRSPV